MNRLILLLTISLLMLSLTAITLHAADGAGLAAKVAAAQPGTVVAIPAGTFELSGLAIPAGVSLKGAGFDKTVLAINGQVGIQLTGGKSSVSDLTVQDAASAGIRLSNAQYAAIARVRVLRCLTGILVDGGNGNRIENCAAGENRTGIVVNRAVKSAVINCTLARNSALGLSISNTKDCAAFNNLLATNAIGVFLGGNTNLALDYNVYWGALIGKGKDISMPTIYSWRDMEQQDRHSIALAVDFANAQAFDYTPATPMPWAPDRAATAGWGTPQLAGFTAPKADIHDQPHRQGICAGAWEAQFTAACPPDGTFTIQKADGYKSAGLYDANNRQVAWLFNMLPLPKGKYSYWLPSRDWQGRPIPAGAYTLRISEANLSMKYIASPGNTAKTPKRENYSSTGIDQVVYDSKERPILCLHWSESYCQFRSLDPNLEQEKWNIPGCATTYGAASDGQGFLYSLREADGTTSVLSRIDEETGKIQEVAPGEYGWYLKNADIGDIRGIAVLGGTVYLASGARGKLLAGPDFKDGISVPSPQWPAADRARNLIWVISERKKVLAIAPDGTVKYTFAPNIPGLFSLAVNGNRLVLLSPFTGKVYLYNITDPAKPQQVRTIGTGDGPYGSIQPDRFHFQISSSEAWVGHCKLALDSQGTVAVTDSDGVKLFNWDGTARRDFSGIWGQYIEPGAWAPGEDPEIVDESSLRTMKLDEKTGTWRWGAMYGQSGLKGFTRDTSSGFFFMRNGKRFGAWNGNRQVVGSNGKTQPVGMYLIVRYDDCLGTPVLALGPGADGKLARFDDFSKEINDLANWKPVLDGQGQPLPCPFNPWNAFVSQRNGDLLLGENTVWRVPLRGLDADGKPDYDFSKMQAIRLHGDAKDNSIISPYDMKTKENEFPGGVRHAEIYPDDTLISTVYLKKTGHGSGMCNWSGTEVAGFDASGTVRWLQPMASIKDPEGTKILDNLSYSVACPLSEIQILDKDGMFLGVTGAPHDMYWNGMWLDNSRQFAVIKGNTGKHYVFFGNFNDCTTWWFEVQGRDTIRYSTQEVVIDDAKSQTLAALPEPPPIWRKPDNTTTRVKVVKLPAPLPMDGDLAKWRAVLPTPQVIITPETGPGINGPADASALIRLAHEGGNLYIQMLRFDNLVTMHQPLAMFYKQDALEMAINSFTAGIKINVTHTRDKGDIVYRDGWFLKAKELDPAKAPRKVYVLDSAKDVPERKIIEQIYGVDLSGCKVIVTEFKVPLDDDTFEGRKEAKPVGISGSTLHLGIGVDDSDAPGADLQKMMVWPATYNTFGDISVSAVVELE